MSGGVVNEPRMCLEPETLAMYLDGRLDARARAEVEAHLATCEDCYEWFIESVRTPDGLESDTAVAAAGDAAAIAFPAQNWADQADRVERAERVERVVGQPPARVLPMRRRMWPRVAAGVALAASLVLAARLQPSRVPDWAAPLVGVDTLNDLVADLRTAQREYRPTQGRLTGSDYAPERPVYRSGGGPTASTRPEIEAVQKILGRAQGGESPEELHAIVLADLALSQFDESSVGAFDRATRANPTPEWLSDLSAVYLAAAQVDRRWSYEQALSAADRAIALSPQFAAAHFNRALALEGLSRTTDARLAWERYLSLDPQGHDPQGKWADEARGRLALLPSATSERP